MKSVEKILRFNKSSNRFNKSPKILLAVFGCNKLKGCLSLLCTFLLIDFVNAQVEQLTIFKDQPIHSLCITNNGIIHLATTRGVFELDNSSLKNKRLLDIEFINHLTEINGDMWAGSNENSLIFLNEPTRTYHFSSYPIRLIKDIEYENGWFWVATYGDGLKAISRDKNLPTKHFLKPAENNSEFAYINSIHVDATHRKWIGTEDGVFTINNGVVKRIESNEEPEGRITKIISFPGQLWLGGIGKMWVYDLLNESFTVLDLQGTPLENSKIEDLAFDRAGNLWIASDVIGYYRVEEDQLHIIDKQDGFVSQHALCMGIDSAGYVWVGTEGKGLFKINPAFLAEKEGQFRLRNNNLPSVNKDKEMRQGLFSGIHKKPATIWKSSLKPGVPPTRITTQSDERELDKSFLILLDASNSMNSFGRKKIVSKMLTNFLGDGSKKIELITYSSKPDEARRISSNKDINEVLGELYFDGDTRTHLALKRAYSLAVKKVNDASVQNQFSHKIVLITDGGDARLTTRTKEIIKKGLNYNIKLDIISVKSYKSINKKRLKELAKIGGGAYKDIHQVAQLNSLASLIHQ